MKRSVPCSSGWHRLTGINQFVPHEFIVPYEKAGGEILELSYTVWVLDGMAWLRELARDKTLKDEWRWYAVKKFKCKGDDKERFIDEPLSGQEAWEYEVWFD